MSGMLKHNGYSGTVEFNDADNILFGKIFGINDLVSYEGTSVDKLKAAFIEAVDDYIQTCKKLGKEPEKAFRGSFNVRIKPELHKSAAYQAEVLGQSLNEFVESSIALRIQHVSSPTARLNAGKKGTSSKRTAPKPSAADKYDVRRMDAGNEQRLAGRSLKRKV